MTTEAVGRVAAPPAATAEADARALLGWDGGGPSALDA